MLKKMCGKKAVSTYRKRKIFFQQRLTVCQRFCNILLWKAQDRELMLDVMSLTVAAVSGLVFSSVSTFLMEASTVA